MSAKLSYAASGINISETDAAKQEMKKSLATSDKRVLNTLGAFASLVDGRFPKMKHPVLVLKTEEPGSKQLLAIANDRVESICEDMINHLINDIAVMGATPLFVQDAVICGTFNKKIVTRLVAGVAAACRAQGCTLTGGETSVQPGVLKPNTYVLTSSVVGIVDKKNIIDGSRIQAGDTVLAVASNGLHTNGYTLVRTLMEKKPKLKSQKIAGETFFNHILRPHVCYFQAIKKLFTHKGLHSMAHITGGGIEGNLNRVLPKHLDAVVDQSLVQVLPLFSVIQKEGQIDEAEMRKTFNLGVGLTVVVAAKDAKQIQRHLKRHGHNCYPIGTITKGKGNVRYTGKLRFA
jgi:phosphoribosylformylglycinamidine cyclo-ligase